MLPLEKLEIKTYNIEDDFLLYVEQLALEKCPDIDFDNYGYPVNYGTQAVYKFVDRYNEKKLNYGFTYVDYIADNAIQETLKEFKVNIDLFWFLLLFVRDYAHYGSYDGLRFNDSPKEDLEKILQKIHGNLIDKDDVIYASFIKPMSIDIKIKDDRSLSIQNPTTVAFIAELCKHALERMNENRNILNHRKGFGVVSGSETFAVWIFAQMFIAFFDMNPQFKGKKKKNSSMSINKNLLISRLAYFTKLTKNRNYYDDDDALKKVIKSFKDKDFKIINNIY